MWAVREDGTWRYVDKDIPLDEGELLFEEIPQWAIDLQADEVLRREKAEAEFIWQQEEISRIANQLMALEEAEATGEDTGALPGTRLLWLQYRTMVRNWKDGAAGFPDLERRPIRSE